MLRNKLIVYLISITFLSCILSIDPSDIRCLKYSDKENLHLLMNQIEKSDGLEIILKSNSEMKLKYILGCTDDYIQQIGGLMKESFPQITKFCFCKNDSTISSRNFDARIINIQGTLMNELELRRKIDQLKSQLNNKINCISHFFIISRNSTQFHFI